MSDLNKNKKNFGYTLGLDLGIASVGWCLLEREVQGDKIKHKSIIDLGVRTFSSMEADANIERRLARLSRRRLRRKSLRLRKLVKIFKEHKLINGDTYADLLYSKSKINPWQLRVKGLKEKLNPTEWARVIYHICKHRGFYWISKAKEYAEDENNGTKVESNKTDKKDESKNDRDKNKDNLQLKTKILIIEEELEARRASGEELTIAEYVCQKFVAKEIFSFRNRKGEYIIPIKRERLGKELKILFEKQREFGNPYTQKEFEALISSSNKTGILWEQRPPLEGDDILNLVGKCTYEKDEYRAPVESFSAERHTLLVRIINLRFLIDGHEYSLTPVEKKEIIKIAYTSNTNLTYKKIKEIIITCRDLSKDSSIVFKGLLYKIKNNFKSTENDDQEKTEKVKKEKSNKEDLEKKEFLKLNGWHKIRKILQNKNLSSVWDLISSEAISKGKSELIDNIINSLCLYKVEENAKQKLTEIIQNSHIRDSLLKYASIDIIVDALLYLNSSVFSSISFSALRKINKELENGLGEDKSEYEAIAKIYPKKLIGAEEKSKYLKSLYCDRDKNGKMIKNQEFQTLTNPIVIRSLNQARKVLNKIIQKYGSPAEINIELARDLSLSKERREEIIKEQNKNKKVNDETVEQVKEDMEKAFPNHSEDYSLIYRNALKKALYNEQRGKSMYSLSPLNIQELYNNGYVEVDHILPYSRSFDNSKSNKALVLAKENQDKKHKTPYEYLGGPNSEDWKRFANFVNQIKSSISTKKYENLLVENLDDYEQKFIERNLNDTRYITTFFKDLVESNLSFQNNDGSANKCMVLSGKVTARLREIWKLKKDREESDLHHAQDAFVIAACNRSFIKAISDANRKKEINLKDIFHDPWPGFKEELEHKIKGTFVSRCAVRKNTGKAHIDSIYSLKLNKLLKKNGKEIAEKVVSKKALKDLSNDDLSKICYPKIGSELFDEIKKRMAKNENNAKIAFSEKEGALFEKPERIYSIEVKIQLVDLKKGDLNKIYVTKNNEYIVDKIKSRMRENNNDSKKAFSYDAPLYDKGKNRISTIGLQVQLIDLEEEHLDKIDIPENNRYIVDQIKIRMQKNNNNAKQSFRYDAPLYNKVQEVSEVHIIRDVINVRKGISHNDSMLRLDIYEKDGKYSAIPIYVASKNKIQRGGNAMHTARENIPVTKADFVFSLYRNDLVNILSKKSKSKEDQNQLTLYYHSFNRSDGRMYFNSHNKSSNTKKELMLCFSLHSIKYLKKLHIDVLGNIYPSMKKKNKNELA